MEMSTASETTRPSALPPMVSTLPFVDAPLAVDAPSTAVAAAALGNGVTIPSAASAAALGNSVTIPLAAASAALGNGVTIPLAAAAGMMELEDMGRVGVRIKVRVWVELGLGLWSWVEAGLGLESGFGLWSECGNPIDCCIERFFFSAPKP